MEKRLGRLALVALVVTSALTPIAARANAPTISVTQGSAAFYPNPSGGGAFDATADLSPLFTQGFPLVNFNPGDSCASQDNGPWIDSIPQPDGTCRGIAAQGNGYQAGVKPDAFEMSYQATFVVASAGQINFQITADDGWFLGIGPAPSAASPSYVSGPQWNIPASTPMQGYPVLGGYNDVEGPSTATLSVSFPAAGQYPLELDYAENGGCCAQELSMGTDTEPVIPAWGGTIPSTLTAGSGSVMTDPQGNRVIAIPSTEPTDLSVTASPICPDQRFAPSAVVAVLAQSTYPMNAQNDGSYAVTIPADEVVSGVLTIEWRCGTEPFSDVAGIVSLYDPAGTISHPISLPHASAGLGGAIVTLFSVPGYRPQNDPTDNGPGTCETSATEPPGGYDDPPPGDVQPVQVDPSQTQMSPPVNPFISNDAGLYGWLLPTACYFVTVHHDGFVDQTSAMVGIPPAVTDLNILMHGDESSTWAPNQTMLPYVTVSAPVVGRVINTVHLNGSSSDPLAPIVAVHVLATSSTGASQTHDLALPNCGSSCSWTFSEPLGPGRWTLTALAENDQGAVEEPSASNSIQITVVGTS